MRDRLVPMGAIMTHPRGAGLPGEEGRLLIRAAGRIHRDSRALSVVDTAVLRPAIPAQAAEESWVVATDLAEALARAGTPFHQAHQIAGRLVLESVRSGKKPSDWTPEQLVAFAPEFTAEMAKLFVPAEGMKTRVVPGGTSPASVAAALDQAAQRLEQLLKP